MLILTRRTGEDGEIGGDYGNGETLFDAQGRPVHIKFGVLGVKGNQVRMGIECPKHVPIHRSEIAARIRRELMGPIDGNVAEPAEAEPAHA